MRHDVAAREQVVELVRSAELDVGLDRDRVVGLHERVEELRDRDRLARAEALLEVVALEHPRDRDRPREAHDVGVGELREPLAVPPQLERLRLGADDRGGVLEEAARVALDLLVGQDRALRRPAGRVADARRVVADDQDRLVPLVLERAHPLERDAAPDVDVGRGHVDPELDAQRPPEGQLRLEAAGGQDVDGVPRQVCQRHASYTSGRPGSVPEKESSAETPAHPQAQTPRPRHRPRAAGPGFVHLRVLRVRLRAAPRRPAVGHLDPSRGEHLPLRAGRADGARDPPRRPGAHPRPERADQPAREARDRRGRGQALLRAPRGRRARDRARRLGGHPQQGRRRGRVDDHPAVRQELDQPERPHHLAEAARGGARVAARAALEEGPDPDGVPEHGVLRERRLRRRAGLADLLPPPRGDDAVARGGAARGDPEGPVALRPGRAPPAGEGSPRRRAARAARQRVRDAQPVPGRAARADAEPGGGDAPVDAGRGGAVLRELRQGPAREPARAAAGLRRRPAREDDARRRAPVPRAAGDRRRRCRSPSAPTPRSSSSTPTPAPCSRWSAAGTTTRASTTWRPSSSGSRARRSSRSCSRRRCATGSRPRPRSSRAP